MRIPALVIGAAAPILVLAPAASRAQVPFDVAITIDDVPWVGATHGDAALRHTRRMIATLRAHRAPVAVFVRCGGDASFQRILREWREAGATIGNHTTGHPGLHATDPHAWAEAVRSCDRSLASQGIAARWFRFPQLHQGTTSAQRDTAAAVLRELRYRNAPVTIDNNDYLLAAPYDRAVARGESAERARIRRLMVSHDSLATSHFRAVARQALGRDVAHVLLLHANAMTADALDELLTTLHGMGARFVSLEEAMRDPVYAMPDHYQGPKGASWLYRVQRGDHVRMLRWDDDEGARLRRALVQGGR